MSIGFEDWSESLPFAESVSHSSLNTDLKSETSSDPNYELQHDNDVHLSSFLPKRHCLDEHVVPSNTNVAVTNLTSSTETLSPSRSCSIPIKLYYPQMGHALVIRTGPMKSFNLNTIVFDFCLNHDGKRSSWENKISVAFSHEELIRLFQHCHSFKSNNPFLLKFHNQQHSTISISTYNKKLLISTKFNNKDFFISGDSSHRFLFLAMLEESVMNLSSFHYPSIPKDRILEILLS